jgi:hypothetical protein
MKIYCCECKREIKARLTNGKEIYPHRKDLFNLPFWKCDICGNYLGCHHKTKNRTNPLGVIPNKELKNARMHIHAILDPLWKEGKIARDKIYSKISNAIGTEYHTANIKTIEEARNIYRIIKNLAT